MFTGIITDVGRIESVEARGDLHVRIACGYDMSTVDLGASMLPIPVGAVSPLTYLRHLLLRSH